MRVFVPPVRGRTEEVGRIFGVVIYVSICTDLQLHDLMRKRVWSVSQPKFSSAPRSSLLALAILAPSWTIFHFHASFTSK